MKRLILCLLVLPSLLHAGRFDRLEGLALMWEDYIQDRKSAVQRGEKTQAFITDKEETTLSEFLSSVRLLQNGTKNPNHYLQECLETRLRYLMTDITVRAAAISQGSFTSGFFSTCSNKEFCQKSILYQSFFSTDNSDHLKNKDSLACEQQLATFKELRIKYLFDSIPPRERSAHTKRLLQLSPSLWPLLENESSPPQPVGHRGGLDTILFFICQENNNIFGSTLDQEKNALRRAADLVESALTQRTLRPKDMNVQQRLYFQQLIANCDGALYSVSLRDEIVVQVHTLGGKKQTMCIMDPSDLQKGVWGEVLRRPAFLFPDSAEAPAMVALPRPDCLLADSAEAPCARAAASSFLDEKLLSSLHPKETRPSIQKRSKRKWGYNIPLPRAACASEKSSSISTSDECSSASDSDDSFTNNDDKENSSPNLRALESEGEKRKTDRVDELNDLPAAAAYEEASVMHAPAAAMADDMSLVMPSSTLPRSETTPEEPWVYPNGLRKMHKKLLDQERPRIAIMPPR